MTFVCPICKEIASSQHEKHGTNMKKKGKNWRERKTERVKVVTTPAGLAFFCPCCKEQRSLHTHNPFAEFTSMGHKNFKREKKKKLRRLKSTVEVQEAAAAKRAGKEGEVTVLTAEGLARELGFAPEDVDRAGFRVHRNSHARVSWSDADEMRRLILKDVLLHAVLEPLLVLQCASRCWRAQARVKKAREMALKSSKKKKKKRASNSLEANPVAVATASLRQLQMEETKEGKEDHK